ncbi:uncharacterized protein LOC115620627 [Scaptodrosophila lebanonensis]|uniref:Uncharacterized protein LOC115620627 n=1 Tax=Drosophila lebanonensis TaxID=7225 RepID=A0A6J2SZ11_DROLE|nr:uncharacterized protein LOC115620627 [Scaptodrosophila lebanonensis]
MEQLDDLCLLLILSYLRLPDQVAMFQAYPSIRSLLGSMWHRRLHKIELNLLQLRILRLNNVDADKFSSLLTHTFPELQQLQIDARPPFFLSRSRQRELRKIFPARRLMPPAANTTPCNAAQLNVSV